MPPSTIHIKLFRYDEDFPSDRQRDIRWINARKEAEKMAEELGYSVEGVSVR